MNELIYVVSAFVLGGLHALEPGHGKTVVAAYLVGSKGRLRDAFLLGGVVTFTHTFSIILLGIVTAVAAAYLVPETVHDVLEVFSGLLVLGVGLWMLNGRLRKREHGHADGHSHEPAPIYLPAYHFDHAHQFLPEMQLVPVGAAADHVHGDLTHSHPLPIDREHVHESTAAAAGGHDHEHQHEHGHSHGHSHAPRPGERPSLGGLVALGVSGGMVPCPAALALLLAAVGTGNILGGVSLVVIFSLGLAVVLIAIGVALVKAADVATSRLGGRLGGDGALARRASMASAVVVTLLGVTLTARAAAHVAGLPFLG